jgi:hypothetical protein
MTESEHVALEHIRSVAESILGRQEESPGSTPNASILPVPYVSQIGSGADKFNNDSGAAAGAMLVRAYTAQGINPDDFFTLSGVKEDAALTLSQINTTLATYGVSVELRSALKLGDLALAIASGRPVILPVKYEILKNASLVPGSDPATHCLVAVGLDVNNIYVHDPLHHEASGQASFLPWLVFHQAWSQAAGYDRAALIPRQSLLRRVRVTASNLNIRSQPDPNASIAGAVKLGDAFEVTAQKNGWGKIGEGKWINLSYTTDI